MSNGRAQRSGRERSSSILDCERDEWREMSESEEWVSTSNDEDWDTGRPNWWLSTTDWDTREGSDGGTRQFCNWCEHGTVFDGECVGECELTN